MSVSKATVVRGLSRLYLLIAAGWLVYIFVWTPTQIITADIERYVKFGGPLPDSSPWGTKWWHIVVERGFVENPVGMSLLAFGVPLHCGYGMLRAILRVSFWIMDGFRGPPRPS